MPYVLSKKKTLRSLSETDINEIDNEVIQRLFLALTDENYINEDHFDFEDPPEEDEEII
jgi:hypothetical protein